MITTETVILAALCYIGVLFAVAYIGDKRADAGRSIINRPSVYALSLAVYCTAWTFYGSVGRAVRSGPGFLAIYIGPTLMAILGWVVVRKILRISRIHRITSIADFIASRYGKSVALGGVVTGIAVFGIVPYISLQLKAVSASFLLLAHYPESIEALHFGNLSVFGDTTFYVAVILAVFAVLFGTRKPEVTERHEGLVAAIALESVVKLAAFGAIGIFVTYGLYGGFADLFNHMSRNTELARLLTFEGPGGAPPDWGVQIVLSMLAVVLLPRQFQMTVVENIDEAHLRKAMWLFPLYLLAINFFVLPVAVAGILQFGATAVDPDTFVLRLPLAHGRNALALLVFIGGMSAATGMVVVETIALSTMISNNLVMPILLHIRPLRVDRHSDLGAWLVAVRHGAIVAVILLGYVYFRQTAEYYPLVAIGLVSFAAVAQFAPVLFGGIFWKGGTRAGALSGLCAGFLVWLYTLVLPTMTDAGLMPLSFIQEGPWGVGWLRPFRLFGLAGFDSISHGVFWSLLANTGAYIGVSLFTRQSPLEQTQAAMFVNVFHLSGEAGESTVWRGTALVPDLTSLLERFLGEERTREILDHYMGDRDAGWGESLNADPDFVTHVETMLAGVIGSASARVMVSSVVTDETFGIQEVMDIVDETRQVINYSHELEKVTADLKEANERLQELDRLKDEFISTVTHELRTPLTAIQSIAEILRDYPDTGKEEKSEFLAVMITETQRLSRLINQVLDFQKIEAGRMAWQLTSLDLCSVIRGAIDATHQLVAGKEISLTRELPEAVPAITGDRDQLMQMMINLISNAVKFCAPGTGEIHIALAHQNDALVLSVRDNGIGISEAEQQAIFEPFTQISAASRGRPQGSGLGLAITKRIVAFHGGGISVWSAPNDGATFTVVLPVMFKGGEEGGGEARSKAASR